MNALRLYYLTTYLGLGAVLPLLALAMQARGLRPTQYGFLVAFLPLSRLLAPPLWGAVADKWIGTATLLRVNTLLCALGMAMLSQALGFAGTVLSFCVWAFFSSSLVPLAEASTYRLLGTRATSFGYIRMFGSIGFAISAALTGLLGAGEAVDKPFVFAAGAYGLAFLVSLRFPDAHVPLRAPLMQAVRALAEKSEVVLLWVGSTLYYVAHGAFDVYFGPHVAGLPGVSREAVSLAWAIGVVFEVALSAAMPSLLRRFSSHALLIVAAMVSVLRWLLLARATGVAHVWALAPLHAITFGLWYLAFVHANQEGAPSALRATVQGFAAACLGLGMIVATLLGGYVMEHLGGRLLFELAAVCALLAAVCYGARARLAARSTRQLASTSPES